jgi:tight adherence protein C
MELDPAVLNVVMGLIVGYAIFVLFLGFAALRMRDRVQVRVDLYATRVRTLEDIELDRPIRERVVQPLLRSLAGLLLRFVPRIDLDGIQLKLYRAGSPFNWTPVEFLGVRVGIGLLFIAPGLLLLWLGTGPLLNALLLTGVLGALGFLLPGLWLGRKTRARQHEIQRNLPDALDFLTVSVEAGLGLEAAMTKVSEYTDNEMGRVFARALTEIQLGRARSEALRLMALRADVGDFTHFVTALIQAENLGVSITKVLRLQSDEMRVRRRQRAEEEAHRAPVKMSVVLVLLLLPSLFLIILGPSAQRITCPPGEANTSILCRR